MGLLSFQLRCLLGHLSITLFLSFLLFLVLKDFLELRNCTRILISELLELRSVLLLAFFKARPFIFLIFTKQLSHELIRLFA